MPRNMSFFMTTEQIKNQTKTVTRRLGWKFLKPGDVVWAVEKAQGLKKGEKINRLCKLRIVSVRRERIDEITQEDCVREGFPDMFAEDFIHFFCKAMDIVRWEEVTRIEFEYVEE
jgi:hypothetical protein